MQSAKLKQTIWFQKYIQPAPSICGADLCPPIRTSCSAGVVAVEVAARLAAVRDEDERRTASRALLAAASVSDWGLGGLGPWGRPNEMGAHW